jgi:hypothetical protein
MTIAHRDLDQRNGSFKVELTEQQSWTKSPEGGAGESSTPLREPRAASQAIKADNCLQETDLSASTTRVSGRRLFDGGGKPRF